MKTNEQRARDVLDFLGFSFNADDVKWIAAEFEAARKEATDEVERLRGLAGEDERCPTCKDRRLDRSGAFDAVSCPNCNVTR